MTCQLAKRGQNQHLKNNEWNYVVKKGNYLLYVIKEVGKPVLNWQQFRNNRKCFFIKQLQCGTQCPQGLVEAKQHTGSNGDQRNEQWIHATKHMSVSEAATQLFVRSWKDRAGKDNSIYLYIYFLKPFLHPTLTGLCWRQDTWSQ